METRTTIQQHQEAKLTDFCQLDIQQPEEFNDPVYMGFLDMLRKIFIELDMGNAFRRIPRK